ncbi:MAG: radical SAM protein [Methanocellales archaeon]|nr:radical SAM protein [Methanocellales archaeon]
MFFTAVRTEKCRDCGSCKELTPCPSEECTGCGACSLACPYDAIEMIPRAKEGETSIKVDGEVFAVPDRITVRKALEILGHKITKFPGEGLFVPCEVGGCWSCAVKINGRLSPSCTTAVKEGMEIETSFEEVPRRIVHGFSGHGVGGVGTPWVLKDLPGYVEAACFACGCNFRCPQCQNWTTTYRGAGAALTPRSAAEAMTATRRAVGVDRMAISGGESTLNRRWLIQYIQELRKLNQDEDARFHVDTNGSILTDDYMDALVEAGMTDIGIDLKGLDTETFMRITGIKDERLAENYHKTAWEAVRYILDNHKDKVFLGIGIPYNRSLISIGELQRIGERIFALDAEVQVCVLDYRPEFRNKDISRPSYSEMKRVHETLTQTGLKTVTCQTMYGHIGP